MRTMIRGGVWKNTEDEILKVGVMKYGHMEWDRVASLLSRKSARQCKARWYEFLDPSIKHTEWSREEEEKLLHLAKLMPNQWRTVAPLVGRTAMQCLEKYEQLLDAAEGKQPDEDDPDDPRRLRAGEIDPAPETRAARPDPVDMDEDEKEMLMEARARLANTKGKKAKRKEREKRLEETRRLQAVLNRRELKAAGVRARLSSRHAKRRKREVDFVTEVPFERPAKPGFYDTSREAAVAERFTGIRDFDKDRQARNRDEDDEKLRNKDREHMRKMAKANAAAVAARNAEINDPLQQRRRSELSLPAPQVSDAELATIVKGVAAPGAGTGAGAGASGALVGEYAAPALPTPMRTPRLPQGADVVAAEAANLLALQQGATPLLGGGSGSGVVVSGGTGFAGATPSAAVAATPRPLAAGATPLPDAMGINVVAEERRERKRQRKALEASLLALPEPEFEYEIAAPEAPEADEEAAPAGPPEDEDEEDRAARLAREAEEREAAERRRWSQAVQRGLPRPAAAPAALADDVPGGAPVAEEMLLLLQRDAAEHPQAKRATPQPAARRVPAIPDAAMAAARALVEEEAQAGGGGAPELDFGAWEREVAGAAAELPLAEQRARFDAAFAALEALVGKNNRLEKRVAVLHKGYGTRHDALTAGIAEAAQRVDRQAIEIGCYEMLENMEKSAIPRRVAALKAALAKSRAREGELQGEYATLCQ